MGRIPQGDVLGSLPSYEYLPLAGRQCRLAAARPNRDEIKCVGKTSLLSNGHKGKDLTGPNAGRHQHPAGVFRHRMELDGTGNLPLWILGSSLRSTDRSNPALFGLRRGFSPRAILPHLTPMG